MLFVINPYDVIHTATVLPYIRADTEFYVLDTEDLSVEKISGEALIQCMSSGLQFSNLYTGKTDVALSFAHPFEGYLKHTTNRSIWCLNNSICATQGGRLSFNRKGHQLHEIRGRDYIALYWDSILLCVYEDSRFDMSYSIVYLYKLNDYIVIRYVTQHRDEERACRVHITTSVIVTPRGSLVGVLPDNRYRIKELFTNKDEAFCAKFSTMQERRY